MGTDSIVFFDPGFNDLAHLLQRTEENRHRARLHEMSG